MIHWFGGLLLLAGLASCTKQVQVPPPVTSVSTTTVFNNDNTATAAVLNLYAQMSGDPFTYHSLTAMSSDEYTSFSTLPIYVDIYRNSINALNDATAIGIWSSTFNYLYKDNAILEGFQHSTGMSNGVRQQLTGEALFMRAYWYFYLTNFFGDVPLVTSTNYQTNQSLPRTVQAKVYQQIVRDLQQALLTLSSNYLDATDTVVSKDHIRPNSWAALALLARVYLYTQDWAGADSAASAVIGSTVYSLSPLTGSGSVFMKNSSEAIWQNPPSSGTNYTWDGYFTILTAPPSAALSNCWTISSELMNAFEPGDQRAAAWIGTYTNGANTWYFPYKYRNGAGAASPTEYTMILRLSEQYLIRAEARIQEGNTSGALSDLNTIRNRAGLGNYAGATDKASLLSAVLHERQVELFGEGHRWFDLRRTGSVDGVLGAPGNVCQAKGGTGWNSYQQLYPLPISDIQSDPNLSQNLGY